MCSVLCLRGFREIRGRSATLDAPLLAHADGSFLSQFQFISVFRSGVRAMGFDDSVYLGHSFRIGTATEAARLVLSDGVIDRIGRLESR